METSVVTQRLKRGLQSNLQFSKKKVTVSSFLKLFILGLFGFINAVGEKGQEALWVREGVGSGMDHEPGLELWSPYVEPLTIGSDMDYRFNTSS